MVAADAYVNSEKPTWNYGSATVLRVDASPELLSYLRFNASGLSGTVTRATLRVYATGGSSAGYAVRDVSDDSWLEGAITYATRPAASATVTGSSGAFAAGTWTTVDVTALVSGNGAVSLALTGPSSTAIAFASRETATAPQLIVETAP